jgi:hypothetical protein
VDIQVGSLIAVEAEHVGEPEREGEVLEISERGGIVSYRVRWHDGHESIFLPASGSIRLVDASERRV